MLYLNKVIKKVCHSELWIFELRLLYYSANGVGLLHRHVQQNRSKVDHWLEWKCEDIKALEENRRKAFHKYLQMDRHHNP